MGETRDELTGSDSGLWVVRSAGETVYLVDLDGPPRLLRQPGPTSTVGPHDGSWVPLIDLEAVRVGARPFYVTDPDGGVRDHATWLQRRVTRIERITPDEVDQVVTKARDGDPDHEPEPPLTRDELLDRRDRVVAWLAEQPDDVPLSADLSLARAELVQIGLRLAALKDQGE